SASERPFQASQSPLALRQTRLTESFPAAPPAACWSRQNRRRRLARRRVCCAVGDDALRRAGRRSPRHNCASPRQMSETWRRHDPRAFCQCANCSKIKSRPERVPLVTETIGRVFQTPILGGLISDKDSPLLDDRHLAPSRTKSPRARAPAAQKNTMTRLPVIEPRSAYIW